MTDCPKCEYHKNRAARWRAEAYKQAGHEIELPWVGLTDAEFQWIYDHGRTPAGMMEMVGAKLKEKNT